jgi:hypothetical protein
MDRGWLVPAGAGGSGTASPSLRLRYGTVSRQTVYSRRDRFERDGIAGLREASRCPRTSLRWIAADIEALICEVRRLHRKWGTHRIAFELGRLGWDTARPLPGGDPPGASPQRPG